MAADEASKYLPVPQAEIPRDTEGNCTANLYVFLPTPKKFVLFVLAGEKFTLARKMALEKHSIPVLFVRTTVDGQILLEPSGETSMLDFEILGQGTNRTLKQIFKGLADPNAPAEEAIAELQKVAEDIIKAVAPESEDLKSRLLDNVQHLWVMNNSSAIITIASLFAMANGFDSQKSLRDIVNASLVMDLPLIAMGEDKVEACLRDLNAVPIDLRNKYHLHPSESYRIAKQSLRYFTETALQLILNHHELKNGMGFPSHVRTESLFPLARVFSAAVDAFETLKRRQLMGLPITIQEAVVEMLELNIERHLRRHSTEVLDKVLEFMGVDPAAVRNSRKAA